MERGDFWTSQKPRKWGKVLDQVGGWARKRSLRAVLNGGLLTLENTSKVSFRADAGPPVS